MFLAPQFSGDDMRITAHGGRCAWKARDDTMEMAMK